MAREDDYSRYRESFDSLLDYMGELYTFVNFMQDKYNALERYRELYEAVGPNLDDAEELARAGIVLDGILLEMERVAYWMEEGSLNSMRMVRLKSMRRCAGIISAAQGYFERRAGGEPDDRL